MKDELEVITSRKVWELVEKPDKANVIGCRWVFTLKRNEKNEIVRYKARLVAQGHTQRKGETYDEVFSPVVNFSIIRLFFAVLISKFGWLNCQLDINNAYLYAKLNSEIYMKPPEGLDVEPQIVCKLKKALYGLHQSGREWHFEINKALLQLNFVKFKWCNCLYVFSNNILLILYVDDIVLFGKSSADIDNGIKLLKSKFDLKVLGKTKKLLGVNFTYDNHLSIDQTEYIEDIYHRFKHFKIPQSTLPISKGTVLSQNQKPETEQEVEQMSKCPYRNLVGCLSYIALKTRPDITFAVNMFSQFQENPGPLHWHLLLRLLGYVYQTKNLKLNLSRVQELDLTCFSDSDFAANRDDRISIGGILLQIDQVPIFWRTFKHKSVSLSTMEAEYVTLCESAKELVWIKNVLLEFNGFNLLRDKFKIFLLCCDNEAAINFSKSSIENARTKHIDVKFHFLRNLILDKFLEIKYVPSKANPADNLTKPQVLATVKTFNNKYFV